MELTLKPFREQAITSDQALHLILPLNVHVKRVPELFVVEMRSASCSLDDKLVSWSAGSGFLQQMADEGNAFVNLFRLKLAKV